MIAESTRLGRGRIDGLDLILYFHYFRNMETNNALLMLAALAQDTRLDVFRVLVKAHAPDGVSGGLAAGELAEALDVAPATLSFHLKELSRAGLIVSRKAGRSIIYDADLNAMSGLTEFLLEDCCQGACAPVSKE